MVLETTDLEECSLELGIISLKRGKSIISERIDINFTQFEITYIIMRSYRVVYWNLAVKNCVDL